MRRGIDFIEKKILNEILKFWFLYSLFRKTLVADCHRNFWNSWEYTHFTNAPFCQTLIWRSNDDLMLLPSKADRAYWSEFFCTLYICSTAWFLLGHTCLQQSSSMNKTWSGVLLLCQLVFFIWCNEGEASILVQRKTKKGFTPCFSSIRNKSCSRRIIKASKIKYKNIITKHPLYAWGSWGRFTQCNIIVSNWKEGQGEKSKC